MLISTQEIRVVLEWTTASEIGTIGFYLERLNEKSGQYKTVNKKLLPGMLNPPHGGTYRYIDKKARPERSTLTAWLKWRCIPRE